MCSESASHRRHVFPSSWSYSQCVLYNKHTMWALSTSLVWSSSTLHFVAPASFLRWRRENARRLWSFAVVTSVVPEFTGSRWVLHSPSSCQTIRWCNVSFRCTSDSGNRFLWMWRNCVPPCSHLSSSVMEQNHPAMPPSPRFFFLKPLQSGALLIYLMSHFLYPAHRAVCVEVHSGDTFASNLRGSFQFKA